MPMKPLTGDPSVDLEGYRAGPLAEPSYPAAEKSRIMGNMEDMLRQSGMPEEEISRTVGRIGAKLPGSWGSVAGMAVPWAVGSLIPAGRTIPRIGGQILGNMLGRGAGEAGAQALAPQPNQDVVEAGLTGMMKGILPGVTQGAVGALAGPSRSTLRVQKAINWIKEGTSPEVGAMLEPTKPGSFLASAMPKQMQKAASGNFQSMEEEVSKLLGPAFRFSMTIPGTLQTASGRSAGTWNSQVQLTYEEMRQQIKKLNDFGERPYKSEILNDRARRAKNEADRMTQDMMAQMEAAGK